jgi:glycosyltransferase involved in cell wall biosynthesis
MKRLAVIPSDSIDDYLQGGYSKDWLKDYYNPCHFFDEVYLLSPLEKSNSDLLGMKVIHTPEKDFKKRIKDLGINVVRAYGGNWACRMACENKVSGVPVVVSVHDTNPHILYDSIKKADVVLCVAKAVEKLVLQKVKDVEKIWSLPNRVDFEFMKPVSQDQIIFFKQQYPFKYKILLVGRLTEQKNLDTLIHALSLLGPDYCVISVGKGDKATYETLAKQHKVQNQCFFIDSIAHEDLAKYYSFCDCMCTPSRWEGFGMVFVEALACAAVVVTSDIAPMNEFIKHKENGLLVKDYEDAQALGEMIRAACTDQSLRNHLKQNARKSVEGFERSRIDKLEANYYQTILNMKEAGKFHKPLWKDLLKI